MLVLGPSASLDLSQDGSAVQSFSTRVIGACFPSFQGLLTGLNLLPL